MNLPAKGPILVAMKTDQGRTHITDDLGNDVVTPSPVDAEYDALCAVADAADLEHRAHCLLLSESCPLCHALAELDQVRQHQLQFHHN